MNTIHTVYAHTLYLASCMFAPCMFAPCMLMPSHRAIATDSPAPLAVMNLSPSPLTTTSGRSPRA